MDKKKTKNKKVNPVKKVFEPMSKKLKKSTKPAKKQAKEKLFEDRTDLNQLYLYVVIVDIGISKSVEKLFQNLGSSIQFTHTGKGTATKEILNVLGVSSVTKAVVSAVVTKDRLEEIRQELQIFFVASKKNRGIGFAIPFSSVEGVKVYKYLTQTI